MSTPLPAGGLATKRARTVTCLVLFGCFASVVYYSCFYNPWSKYGAGYTHAVGMTGTKSFLDLWIKKKGKLIDGPTITAESPRISFPDVDEDGIPEMKTITPDGRSWAVIKLVIKDGKAIRFHVLEKELIDVAYFEEPD